LYLLPASSKIAFNCSTSAVANLANESIPASTNKPAILGPIPSILVKSSPLSAFLVDFLGASTLATTSFSTFLLLLLRVVLL